jgi:hypothetical protein
VRFFSYAFLFLFQILFSRWHCCIVANRLLAYTVPYLLTETMLSLRNVLLALCFNTIFFWAQTGATATGAPWQSPNCTVENMKIRKEWYAVPNSSNA